MSSIDIQVGRFVWNAEKDRLNKDRHAIGFRHARRAFEDPKRLIAVDPLHSQTEERFYGVGKVQRRILTIRFTYRGELIRMIGAGFWRRGKRLYEER